MVVVVMLLLLRGGEEDSPETLWMILSTASLRWIRLRILADFGAAFFHLSFRLGEGDRYLLYDCALWGLASMGWMFRRRISR